MDFQPPLLTLDIECSKGTYIRSLAHDLGQRLGVGAHLKTLIRTAYGPFNITDAVTLEQLSAISYQLSASSRLFPLDSVLSNLPSVTLTAEQEKYVRQGKQLSLDAGSASRLRAYGESGGFVGILVRDEATGLWQPNKVFNKD